MYICTYIYIYIQLYIYIYTTNPMMPVVGIFNSTFVWYHTPFSGFPLKFVGEFHKKNSVQHLKKKHSGFHSFASNWVKSPILRGAVAMAHARRLQTGGGCRFTQPRAGWVRVRAPRCWEFPARHGSTPIAGWLIREHPFKMDDDLGLLLLKTGVPQAIFWSGFRDVCIWFSEWLKSWDFSITSAMECTYLYRANISINIEIPPRLSHILTTKAGRFGRWMFMDFPNLFRYFPGVGIDVPFWGFFEHHLQIFVGNYIPNTWVMWKIGTFTNLCFPWFQPIQNEALWWVPSRSGFGPRDVPAAKDRPDRRPS